MADKIIELPYDPTLNCKIISKVGNPFKFENTRVQEYSNRVNGTDHVCEGKKILVMRMCELACMYAEHNSVVYITDNEEFMNKFINKVNSEKYGGDDAVYLVEDWNNIGEFIKNTFGEDMKFDVIIGNPPYGQHGLGSLDLHYEIAENLFEKYNEKMIFIMPGRVCFSTSKKFDKWKKKFTNVSNMDNVGNPFGDTVAIDNVYIFSFENHNTDKIKVDGVEYKSLYEITTFTEYENKFMSSLKNDNPNYNAYRPLGNDKSVNAKTFNDKYFNRFNDSSVLILSSLANGAKNARFISSVDTKYIFTKNELKLYLFERGNVCKVISEFASEQEATNYLDAIQRPLCRFGLAKLQDDQNMTCRCYEYIPDIDWSDDRTQTDEGILELAGFSKEEATEFAEYCKNYINKLDEEWNNRPKKKRKSKKDYFANMEEE